MIPDSHYIPVIQEYYNVIFLVHGDMVDSHFKKVNATSKVEFVNCNLKNITGGVAVANYKFFNLQKLF